MYTGILKGQEEVKGQRSKVMSAAQSNQLRINRHK